MRRATAWHGDLHRHRRYFYPRSPCGERHERLEVPGISRIISIHALLAESDGKKRTYRTTSRWHFYPRSPCGERPQIFERGRQPQAISIPALLAESDHWQIQYADYPADFYPRSPCGERQRWCRQPARAYRDFYPRSPCGERRRIPPPTSWTSSISIHALLAESDAAGWPQRRTRQNFYPRSPCGERHKKPSMV